MPDVQPVMTMTRPVESEGGPKSDDAAAVRHAMPAMRAVRTTTARTKVLSVSGAGTIITEDA